MLYSFGKVLTYWFVRVFFRMRYEGLENIPGDKGFILACNHRSYCDPVFIAHRVPKPVRYMAKAELFKKGILGWMFRSLLAFPVERGKGDTGAIGKAVDIIRAGGVMGMFPEGTRSKDGQPRRPRSGVALIAAQTGADVLPCAVCYGEKLRFRTTVTVRYGKLITAEQLGVRTDSSATVKAASRRIMADIVALLEKGVA